MFQKIKIPGETQKLIVYLGLLVATFAVYWQVHQFDFVNIEDASVQELARLLVGIGNLPAKLLSTLTRRNSPNNEIVVISLPDAELFFVWKDMRYLNVAHPLYNEFIDWSKEATDNEIELYLAGVLQERPQSVLHQKT